MEKYFNFIKIERFYMFKVSNIPKLSHRLNTIPFKIPTRFFKEPNKLILKFIGKNKGPRKAKTFLKKHEVRRFAQKMLRFITELCGLWQCTIGTEKLTIEAEEKAQKQTQAQLVS